jgi:AcrR family transcriptional regulator
VAREARVAKGTLYLYFDSKDTLFAAIGTLKTGDPAAKPYRTRLTALTEILVEALDRTGHGSKRPLFRGQSVREDPREEQ